MRRLLSTIIAVIVCLSGSADNGHNLWLGDFMNMNGKELIDYWQGQSYEFSIDGTMPKEGYSIKGKKVNSGSDIGLLYAAYELTRQQKEGRMSDIKTSPAFSLRVLNHWDDIDGNVGAGYSGRSIFWTTGLPYPVWSKRIEEYARACCSIGINGCVPNNVNASPEMLTKEYIDTLKSIADILRPYGVKLYLAVNFASPKALGDTKTADPLDAKVRKWWINKAKQVYKKIPDLGGFIVKANCEGQPGPFDYGRTHADGANMLADAVKPFGGIVFWRCFVYGAKHKDEDRVMQAVSEFKDLDGQFRDNVILQSKNGPLDFQPREPYAPLFDNIKKTTLAVEFQVTQEYTGQSKHLVYLSPMWTEFFSFVNPNSIKAMTAVSNVGNDVNWCGHPFSQANWYAFGRLAWNPYFKSEEIADEWVRQTFPESKNADFLSSILQIMDDSREACVDYMMPLGLHHIFKFDVHYGPEPDGFKAEYPIEWCPVYYHKADSMGVGFNRTTTGSGAVNQYRESYRHIYNNIETCPEEYLLWFHHVAWNYKMKNGRTLWQNLCTHYYKGVDRVGTMRGVWNLYEPLFKEYGDADRWQHVHNLLNVQYDNACEWRDTCLKYFQTFSRQPIE